MNLQTGDTVYIKAQVLEVRPKGVKVQIARTGGILDADIVGGSNNGAPVAVNQSTKTHHTVLEFLETIPPLTE